MAEGGSGRLTPTRRAPGSAWASSPARGHDTLPAAAKADSSPADSSTAPARSRRQPRSGAGAGVAPPAEHHPSRARAGLGTIRDVDRICMLDAGRIVEHGTHEQPIRRDEVLPAPVSSTTCRRVARRRRRKRARTQLRVSVCVRSRRTGTSGRARRLSGPRTTDRSPGRCR